MEFLTEIKHQNKFINISIAYYGLNCSEEFSRILEDDIDMLHYETLSEMKEDLAIQNMLSVPDILMIEVNDDVPEVLSCILDIKKNLLTSNVGIVLLGFGRNKKSITSALGPHVNDIYFYPFNVSHIRERLKFILKLRLLGNSNQPSSILKPKMAYKLPIAKRLFDIIVSSSTLLVLSPLMALIGILIKIDSKGPIVYTSKRSGFGYKIFEFYKFRSMKVDADKELSKLADLNQYAEKGTDVVFMKLKNDPRVTRLGAFLRKTSLDELPQLFNVLKGDISLVGNRPLPLYEAQMLTSDEWAMRFLGPAGITGLWQVSKRGKSEMSDAERRQLDNYYAEHYSMWMDIKILLKTIPALLQKEAV